MNKADLVDAIANGAKISKSQAEMALSTFISTTGDALSKGERVALVGFGSFTTTMRNGRTGRNPQTGQPIQIPSKRVVKFKPGRDLIVKMN